MRFESILEWFSGKARETIVSFTIPALVESEQLGYWKKGVARTVCASLNKQSVAQKLSRAIDDHLGEPDRFGNDRKRIGYDHPLYDGTSDMLYGQYGRAPRHLTAEAKKKRDAKGNFTIALKTGPVNVNKAIERWAQAFAPVQELIALLDSRRPKPVFVMKTLSPTVAQNLSAHIGIDVTTLQTPEMHGEYVEVWVKSVKMSVWTVVVDWPEGTKHCQSRFLGSKAGNQQCEACGHAIQNPFNWVPILAYNTDKVPHSLWVGRDCAEKLFGCEVDGDAIYKR